MLLARLILTRPERDDLEVVTGVDTKQMYLDMGYKLVEEYDDGWRAEDDLTPVPPRATEEVEAEETAELPAADNDEGGSQADDNQEGTD